jgi:hypothetical protein
MIKPLKILVAAGALFATASLANAAPVNMGQVTDGVSNGLIQVHSDHRSCRRDWGGWHRHGRYSGDRRSCRRWSGRGRRPDACVKFGPFWYCDY